MDKWAYEGVLEKYETPNGPRLLLAKAGQITRLEAALEDYSRITF